MKNGFTLIELLAVIVILAIIAIIATPIVLNIINDTKESALLRSADFYIDALENEIMLENMKTGGSFNPNACNIASGKVTCDDKELTIKVDGEVPTSGSITFSEGKVTNVNLTYPSGNITLNSNGELVFGESTEKTLKDIAVVSTELGVNSVHSCTTTGTCQPGTAFAIKVNNTNTYKFYVLNDDGNKVTLIMSSNLHEEGNDNPNVAWSIDGCFDVYMGVTCYNTPGPTTALKALKERTSNWTNISKYSYELDYGTVYDSEGNEIQGKYTGEYVQNVRARLPRESDIITESIGCMEYTPVCPDWIYSTNEGYWLSDADPSMGNEFAWWVHYSGSIEGGHSVNDAMTIGVRPVITLTK